MNYLTKLLTAAAVVVGVGFAGTATAAAGQPQKVTAQPSILPYPYPFPYPGPFPKPFPRVDHDYVVFYKPSIFSGWRVYGKFETRNGAQIAALKLERFGTPTRIERVRGFGGIGW